MLAKVQLPGALRQGAAIDQFGAGLGQRAFAEGGEFVVKLARQHELEDGIAQEFEPLVVLHGRALFMRDGRVGEGETQQGGIAEPVVQPFLQSLVSGGGG